MAENEKITEFEFDEKKYSNEPNHIVLYRDVDDFGRVFATAETLHRFRLIVPEYKIVLDNGEEIYEIKPEAANYILNHSANRYAPYDVQYQNFDFDNELTDSLQETAKETKEKTIEEIQIFRDVEDTGRAFVTQEVLDRFHIEPTGLVVLLKNMAVFEIDPVQAINIVNNCDNAYAPYTIRYVSIQFEKEKKPIGPIPYRDDLSTVKEPEKKESEFIEGTKYKKPRRKRADETEEHYVAYLEGYYDSIFTHEENTEEYIPGTRIKKPRNRDIHETEEEYVKYLKAYYNKVFSNGPYLTTTQPRRRKEKESVEDFNEYLAMFYGIKYPKEEKESPKAK